MYIPGESKQSYADGLSKANLDGKILFDKINHLLNTEIKKMLEKEGHVWER